MNREQWSGREAPHLRSTAYVNVRWLSQALMGQRVRKPNARNVTAETFTA